MTELREGENGMEAEMTRMRSSESEARAEKAEAQEGKETTIASKSRADEILEMRDRLAVTELPEIPEAMLEERAARSLIKLKERAKDDPDYAKAVKNARKLRSLMPRAKALKWYVLIFGETFAWMTFGEQNFSMAVTTFANPEARVRIRELEMQIIQAEKEGIPREISLGTAQILTEQLKAILPCWRDDK